jgi:hypothetical protein
MVTSRFTRNYHSTGSTVRWDVQSMKKANSPRSSEQSSDNKPHPTCHMHAMSDGLVFVESLPEELRCPFHLGVLDDPVVGSCGHSFCKTCIELAPHPENFSDNDDEFLTQSQQLSKLLIEDGMRCPICNQDIVTPLFPNHIITAIISQLRVYCRFRNCDNPEDGCRAQVPLGSLATHEGSCLFAKKSGKKQNRKNNLHTLQNLLLLLNGSINFLKLIAILLHTRIKFNYVIATSTLTIIMEN